MTVSATAQVRAALTAARAEGPVGLDRLVEVLYPELRRIARAQLRRLRPGQTIDTTSLVHEAYVKMLGSDDFADRNHFLAASARAMRHILVNVARRKLAAKHGGGREPETLDGDEVAETRAQFSRSSQWGRRSSVFAISTIASAESSSAGSTPA
jgi:RNA polymerase sigma factor (TIGR02999 family)